MAEEIRIDYYGISDRIRDVIRMPRPLRVLVAEAIYLALKLKNLFDLKANALNKLEHDPAELHSLRYASKLMDKIVEILLSSHSINVFALNASISIRLVEKLLEEYYDNPLIALYIEELREALSRSIDECSTYTNIPPKRLVDYYANMIEEEVLRNI